MKKLIFISSHALFNKDGNEIYGTGSALEDYLKDRNKDFIFIRHPIYGGLPTTARGLNNDKNFSSKWGFHNSKSLFLKSFQELYITIRIAIYNNKISLFIGIDPLNALFGLWLKKIGKVGKVIFYTADYTQTRYDNKILNWFYHFIDRYVIKRVDEVWNVSTRITQLRKEQGVRNDKNFFVPNAPAFNKVNRSKIDSKIKHELITVSTSAKSTNFPVIFKAIKTLSKKYPDIQLKIIGLEDWKDNFSRLLKKSGIEKNVQFFASMPHTELLNVLCKSSVGLALYSNAFSWTYYSDSMKVRDFLACGLPVIMTDISSTARDLKEAKAGYIINLNTKELVAALEKTFNSDDNYKVMRMNALKLGKKYDIEKILDKRLDL